MAGRTAAGYLSVISFLKVAPMQLLISPASPFVRKARVVLRELDLLGKVEEVTVSTTPLASSADVIAANPLGKIPALRRPDGRSIYDSRVITRFLDNLAQADLYPTEQLWDILTLEATADAMMDAAVSMTYEARLRPAEKQSRDWIEAQWSKIDRALTALDTDWSDMLDGPLNMGQIAVACALSYLDLRHDGRSWRNGRNTLATWHAQFSQRPSMVATRPE